LRLSFRVLLLGDDGLKTLLSDSTSVVEQLDVDREAQKAASPVK